jgi:rare lipoprotein A
MKLLATAVLACLASPVFAGECLLSPPTAQNPGMSVVAPEMQRRPNGDVLCVSVGDALARIHAQQAIIAAGGYVKQTEFDNSPYRFNMSQDGRRMTADEFEAWMKSKGIRVATGKPTETSAETPPTPAPPGN